MNRTVRFGAIALLTVVLWAALSPAARADLKDLISETQKMNNDSNKMIMAWWIPIEFWDYAFKGKDMTATQVEDFMKVLRPYTIFAVLGGQIGTMAGMTYYPIDSIRKTMTLMDRNGATYTPYADSTVSGDAQNFVSMMKPVFANLMGPMGQNMHFVVFSAADSTGKAIAAAKENGNFSLTMLGVTFKWRLPIDALLIGKTCPKCGLDAKGSWKFCPWCGAKLP